MIDAYMMIGCHTLVVLMRNDERAYVQVFSVTPKADNITDVMALLTDRDTELRREKMIRCDGYSSHIEFCEEVRIEAMTEREQQLHDRAVYQGIEWQKNHAARAA